MPKVYLHIVQFSVSTIDGPIAVETKLLFTPQPRSTSRDTAEIAALILRRRSGRDSTRSLCAMSLMYSQEKSMGVKSGLRGGQSIDPEIVRAETCVQ